MTPTTRDAEISLLIVSLTKEAYPFLTKKNTSNVCLCILFYILGIARDSSLFFIIVYRSQLGIQVSLQDPGAGLQRGASP